MFVRSIMPLHHVPADRGLLGSCVPPYDDCNVLASDGCEANLNIDTQNCGTCGTTCSVTDGIADCVGGQCTVDSCNSPYDDCDGSYENGCETNTNSDPSNCGGCGTTCSISNGSPACDNGECTIASCDSGYADCNGLASDGCETDINTDTNNCGGCTHPGYLPSQR